MFFGILLLVLQAAAPPSVGPPGGNAFHGDPVSLETGLYENESRDFFVDDTFPIALTRTYRTQDRRSRAFGIGGNHNYDIFLVGDNRTFGWIALILPDGGRINYVRTSPGTGWMDAEFTHTSTPSRFFGSRLRWNTDWGGWDLTLTDGTLYQFPASAHAVRGAQGAVVGFRDRVGNSPLKLVRNAEGELLQIATPGGRRLDFTYDAHHRITQVRDDRGRVASYEYDKAGRLILATLPRGRTTRYTYDAEDRMLTVEEDGKLRHTNTYDAAGRAIRQDLGSGGSFLFTYTTDATGRIRQTEVRNPDGRIRRVVFNEDRYIIRDTQNFGTPDEETIIYDREPGTNRLLQQRTVRRGSGAGKIATLSMPSHPAGGRFVSIAVRRSYET